MRKSAALRDRRLQFEQTALPHLDALYAAALHLARNPDDADDLLQETVLRAYRCFYQFNPGTNCRAWLLTILYNNFRTSYRRNVREQLANSNEEFDQEVDALSFANDRRLNPEDLAVCRSTGEMVRRALAALPAEFREALLLVDLQELNYQEVAEVLGIPLGTVKSRVSRARTLLRPMLRKMALGGGKTGT
jgi:RNA polymerase sigma-70 factor (ECF subfamily)